MSEPYSFRACRFILKDIGECFCNDCIKFWLLGYKGVGNSHLGLRQLARENAMTGAINFNLAMKDEAEDARV